MYHLQALSFQVSNSLFILETDQEIHLKALILYGWPQIAPWTVVSLENVLKMCLGKGGEVNDLERFRD